jgi:arylsulfatase A-like enzyme
VVDTLRADHLTAYGGDARTSPNFDRRAKEGTLFLDCHASSPWTLPSVASIFTGL